MKLFVNTITVVSSLLFVLVLTSIAPGAMSVEDALAVRGAGTASGCVTSGPCPACVPHTCTTTRVGALATVCMPAPFGTSGCSLAAGFLSKCLTSPTGTGCTPSLSPAPGSCGTLVIPTTCPSIPAVAPILGTMCDPLTPPACGPAPAPGASPLCDNCT